MYNEMLYESTDELESSKLIKNCTTYNYRTLTVNIYFYYLGP